jgi:hypothetical protein
MTDATSSPRPVFAVTMGFASDEEQVKPGPRSRLFATLAEAVKYANSEYSEYGVQIDDDCWEAE